jgi:hypothetical protein
MIYDTPIHVYPDNDKRPHLLSKFCPCEPTVEVVNGTPIYTHRAYNHRQLFEDLEEWWIRKFTKGE